MERIIGACGLVCSECEAYAATQANDAGAIAKVAEQWSRTYNADIKPESVWCDGCLTAGERKCGHCGECGVRACAASRGHANCAVCADYGCEKITSFFEMVPSARGTLDAIRQARG